ncbi:MAG TPA: hypothetical protein VNO81_10420, partial [Candidatus Nitrosotenuis sp.]|nr:hypothetical protein [Candidatus Nitrosotenuis sp.]
MEAYLRWVMNQAARLPLAEAAGYQELGQMLLAQVYTGLKTRALPRGEDPQGSGWGPELASVLDRVDGRPFLALHGRLGVGESVFERILAQAARLPLAKATGYRELGQMSLAQVCTGLKARALSRGEDPHCLGRGPELASVLDRVNGCPFLALHGRLGVGESVFERILAQAAR